MDPKTLAGIVQVIGIAEALIGSDIIPGLKKFFIAEYALTPEQAATLDAGLDDLLSVKAKLAARRAEIAAGH